MSRGQKGTHGVAFGKVLSVGHACERLAGTDFEERRGVYRREHNRALHGDGHHRAALRGIEDGRLGARHEVEVGEQGALCLPWIADKHFRAAFVAHDGEQGGLQRDGVAGGVCAGSLVGVGTAGREQGGSYEDGENILEFHFGDIL